MTAVPTLPALPALSASPTPAPGLPATRAPAIPAAAAPVRAGSWQAWAAALRLRSLLVAVGPVLVGAALGYARTGALDPLAAALALAAALLVQGISNLQNDVGYTTRGADRDGTRTGLPRATAQGWLPVRRVRLAIVLCAVLATGLGLVLALHRGWPVLAIGAASLLAALAYMGGPRPLAYTPLGELTVFIFFGPVAVVGTDWLLTGSSGPASMLAGCAVGLLAAAALAINNHRDIGHDRLVGRRTLAACVGEAGSRQVFAVLLLLPFGLLLPLAWWGGSLLLLAPGLLLPAAWQLRRDFNRCAPGLPFNAVLFRCFRLGLWFALALAASVLLAHLLPGL